jgi:phosphatidate cytidylyltransferase
MIGLVCGVFGQLGDLYESALKRSFDAKDSGSLLPGHGGILDRIDSMLMPALPVAILVLYYN